MKNVTFVFVVSILLVSSCFAISKKSSDTSAVYYGVKDDQVLNKWLIAGPIPVLTNKPDASNAEEQKKFFNTELLPASEICESVKNEELILNGEEYEWESITSDAEGIIDFQKIYKSADFMAAYAYAEIMMNEDKSVVMGIGSDDGIKIWVNNELVHQNWIGRPVNKDDDLVPFPLKKGTNRILFKVQNMQYGWGFTCRVMSRELFAEKLVSASLKGDLEGIKYLLKLGADVNSTIEPGLTALHAAKIGGRKQVIDLLINSGANQNVPMPPKEKLVDAYFNRLIKKDYPGAAILVAKDGKIIYENAYGLSDIENKIPLTTESVFRIGSITKQFTATAILKLQEEGLIKLDDKLSKYIPDFPRGDEVTIHHLLTHTSGIHSYTGKPDFYQRVTSPIKTEELVNEIKKDTYDFNPGDKYLYNNSAYFILGYIIEKVSGLSYGDYLSKNIFIPLGMKNTGVHRPDLKIEHEAAGYSYENSKMQKALNWDMSWGGGAGSLYSTTEDLFKWNEALFNGKVLSSKSLDAAFTPAKTKEKPEPDPGNGYGYGWGIQKLRGLKVIGHSGGLDGFNSNLMRVTDQNMTVVVLLNSLPADGIDATAASNRIAELYLSELLPLQESYEVNKEISNKNFNDFEGRYEYPGGMVLTVTAEEGKLFAQMTGQQKFEIFPMEENVFFWKAVEAQIKFVRDDKGSVTGAIHSQGGQELKVKKIKEPVIVKLDPVICELYTGEYDLGNGAILVILKEESGMFAQLTGQPRFEIFPESETDFFVKEVAATLQFASDNEHKVTHVLVKFNGQEFNAKKIK